MELVAGVQACELGFYEHCCFLYLVLPRESIFSTPVKNLKSVANINENEMLPIFKKLKHEQEM